MSGGAYDYKYWQIGDLADDILTDVKQKRFSENSEAEAKVKEIAKNLDKLSKMAKEVEWWASGDTGPDTFLHRIKEIENE